MIRSRFVEEQSISCLGTNVNGPRARKKCPIFVECLHGNYQRWIMHLYVIVTRIIFLPYKCVYIFAALGEIVFNYDWIRDVFCSEMK